jgi:hypothetical protein
VEEVPAGVDKAPVPPQAVCRIAKPSSKVIDSSLMSTPSFPTRNVPLTVMETRVPVHGRGLISPDFLLAR